MLFCRFFPTWFIRWIIHHERLISSDFTFLPWKNLCNGLISAQGTYTFDSIPNESAHARIRFRIGFFLCRSAPLYSESNSLSRKTQFPKLKVKGPTGRNLQEFLDWLFDRLAIFEKSSSSWVHGLKPYCIDKLLSPFSKLKLDQTRLMASPALYFSGMRLDVLQGKKVHECKNIPLCLERKIQYSARLAVVKLNITSKGSKTGNFVWSWIIESDSFL